MSLLQLREQGAQHASSAADLSSRPAVHDLSAVAVSAGECLESSPQSSESLSVAATPERLSPWADHASR